MTPNQPTPPKPKRRWYQYSLRTLLIFVTRTGATAGLSSSAVAMGWRLFYKNALHHSFPLFHLLISIIAIAP